MGIGNSNTSAEANIQQTGTSSHNQISLGDSALKLTNATAVQDVMNVVGKTAGKVVESGGDILAAPAVWLKDMQKNWVIYIIATAIILLSLVFFYCLFWYYFNRKKSNSSISNVIELAQIISNKSGILKQQSPLPILNLPSSPSNTQQELSA